jgi:hypothetical protein
MKKFLSLLGLLFVMNGAHAQFTQFAVPTKIELHTSTGFLVYGDFGSPVGCTVPNVIFVSINHSQYKQAYATVLSAYLTKKKVYAYIHSCETLGFYSSSTTVNSLHPGGVFGIAE